MTTTRRAFIRTTAITSAALAAAPLVLAARRSDEPATKPAAADPALAGVSKSDKPLKLLILGGTAFLGPEIVAYAQARGHTLTLFNRGKTRPDLFPDVEKLRGDRDPNKDEGLKALEGRSWDGVIDTSGYYPRIVKASAELLAPSVDHYVFISTVSVYKNSATAGADETDEIDRIEDETVENMGANSANYGPLKALCEQAAERAMPGKVANIRPGYIVGPGDWSGRFNYWPVRIAKGGEVLAPGTPDDPIQVIDVRDLAAWSVRCIEQRTAGVFNACGPADKLRWGTVLDTCKSVTGSDATFTWVDAGFLRKHGQPTDYLPIWISPDGDAAGFHTRSNKRAVAAGLTFSALDVTIRDLLAWYRGLNEERQKRFLAGISIAREAELLDQWRLQNG